MHEASVARQLAREVIRTADLHSLESITTVRLSLGPDSHIPPDTLRMMLAAAWEATPAETANVTITLDRSLGETEARLLAVIGADEACA